MQDIEEEDAVSFKMRNTFQFRPDLGLSGQELVTMPHPLLQVRFLVKISTSLPPVLLTSFSPFRSS